ncbi:MAG TPA: NAD(P)-dependent oxidoreductase [Roseiflexaceae bacterium]|nr:NAD(P)-dependent oxidoreductase [Roseiflexaceae bacterium]
MRVIVTGGTGHIGRPIVDDLLGNGHQVINADRQHGAGLAPLRLVDLEDLGQVMSVLAGCDAVVHAAAIPRPGTIPDHVLFRTNMMTLFNVLEACRILRIPRLVWTSSMSVLGYPFNYRPITPRYLPFDERHPQEPQDPYAISKAFGEQLCDAYAARSGMTITSLRIVWAHTPDTFKRDLLPFWDDPAAGASNLWSYVDTRDCGQAARLALSRAGGDHQACFISAPDTCMPIPTRELVARYLPNAPAVADSLPTYGALFDTARARELLGYEAQYTWESFGLGARARLEQPGAKGE